MVFTFLIGMLFPWAISRDKFDVYIYNIEKENFIKS